MLEDNTAYCGAHTISEVGCLNTTSAAAKTAFVNAMRDIAAMPGSKGAIYFGDVSFTSGSEPSNYGLAGDAALESAFQSWPPFLIGDLTMRILIAMCSLLLAGPAAAQTVTGCSSVPSNRVATSKDVAKLQADADCFARAGEASSAVRKVRLDRIAALAPKPMPIPAPSAAFARCAKEGETCKLSGWNEVRYGTETEYRYDMREGRFECGNDTFGDPAPGVAKWCVSRPSSQPTFNLQPTDTTPITSNFDTKPLIVRGYERNGSVVPPSGKPDVVGAFRMICTPGQLNWDDPVIYPGLLGGSPHLHQWFGNPTGRYDSTYASLRGAGDSTCSNSLNRSAYWVPAMMSGAGKVIQPDYIALYYKRRPQSDPECFRMATKGCVGLPFNFRAVAGFDMKRHGEEQSENKSFSFRCITAGKPSVHRPGIAEALADCGGSGQIMASINFGDCWNGKLDSPDHRSHLSHGSYGWWGYLKCPAAYPYVIPALTQSVAYTIEKGDGDVYLASDRMPGMPAMPPGYSWHADYMAAWDPPTQATWERECIDKLLNCSDGELGDGTMLKRGGLTYKAATRLVGVPARPTG